MITGKKVVFGVPEKIKTVIGAPEGKRRFRFRNHCVGRLFVKSENGIQEFILEDQPFIWTLIPQGANIRP